MFSHQELGIAGVGDPDPLQHLTDDDFNVLVVDFYALQSIDLLHFIDQVLGHFLFAENRQDVVRIG